MLECIAPERIDDTRKEIQVIIWLGIGPAGNRICTESEDNRADRPITIG
jgi:hypothetical protein